MTHGQFLTIGTLILLGCGIKKPHKISDRDNYLDSIVVTEAWLDFDTKKQSSFVDIHKFGRLTIPGKWYAIGGGYRSYGRYEYENEEKDILYVDFGILDTMNFYVKGMTSKEFVDKFYEQRRTFWKGKGGQVEAIEENADNVIGQLTVDSTKTILFLFGLRGKNSIGLYYISPHADENEKIDEKIDFIRRVFNE